MTCFVSSHSSGTLMKTRSINQSINQWIIENFIPYLCVGVLHMLITCLENLKLSWNLTAVREMLGEECWWLTFMFGATPVFSWTAAGPVLQSDCRFFHLINHCKCLCRLCTGIIFVECADIIQRSSSIYSNTVYTCVYTERVGIVNKCATRVKRVSYFTVNEEWLLCL